MKSSQQVIGLPVLGIEEGKYIGRVKKLVVNPQPGKVDFVIVEDEKWYLGFKVLAFKDIQGVGESALTVAGRSSLSAVAERADAVSLMEKNICLNGLKVMSNKGRFVGFIGEYFINDDNGAIVGCQLQPEKNEKPAGIIPSSLILTYGSDALIVKEGFEEKMVGELDESSVTVVRESPPKAPESAPTRENGEDIKPADALKHFEQQQRQYLLGKKVTMRITDNGNVIAEEGDIITDEIIEKAKAADRYIELTMNIRE